MIGATRRVGRNSKYRGYVSDRRQYAYRADTGARYLSGGGWMVLRWDGKRDVHVECGVFGTQKAALASLRGAK